ncbi:methionine aminopeptidase 1D, mitochondrial-like isoform X2 [Varroa jacobsoni]|uniref:Methionine aminopeptidase n=1 Tax=Varroa destructor TaxID=109461 RepID=A0A7M7JL72_VARDE|nr:methionine aminopeptidase 1D, mitochondrial-like isoform X2 [Varroa destructor]XP_022708289.1 methionine aminopeptidase 1D, mitochondrial-like isoform X2 [Varroa jacobsoni]
MLATVSLRASRSLNISRRRITSLTKDNSRRSQKKHLSYEIVIPAMTGVVTEVPQKPDIKSRDQILRLTEACQLARQVLDRVGAHVQEGITTDELDKLAHALCIERGAYPSPLNYKWYPKSICTSVNNVACHGIPDTRRLKDGDIVSVDISVFFNGYHGDCAETYPVGMIDERGWNVIETAKYCLEAGIAVCRDGAKLSAIGEAIEKRAAESNCTVVPYFCGHGIGTYFHGPPNVLHFASDENSEVMRAGMAFTIEPVISEGGSEIVVLEDGWTAVSTDYSRSAQFEHTIVITPSSAEVLTSSSTDF